VITSVQIAQPQKRSTAAERRTPVDADFGHLCAEFEALRKGDRQAAAAARMMDERRRAEIAHVSDW
jgi:hypothetical protein